MRKLFLFISLSFFYLFAQSQNNTEANDRRMQWVKAMDKVVRPVFENMAKNNLKNSMPKDISPISDNPAHRIKAQYLEALSRAFTGIAPWLQQEDGSAEEINLRNQYRKWVIQSIKNATDSTQPDFVLWTGGQPLVDASFFAHGLIRSPWIWQHLDEQTKKNTVYWLQQTRKTIPVYSNWILFSGMIETFFLKYGYDYNPITIEYGVRTFMYQWYTGDGMFSDGNHFHLDYYNSYVIQPFLKEIIDVSFEKTNRYKNEKEKLEKINNRYSEIQERSINADGSFPTYGRSIIYRSGAFHHLANMAYKEQLPKTIYPSQVREGLLAVIQKTLLPQTAYDKNGWLVIGLFGKQLGLADFYNNQGSLYLCTEIFLPLGLSSVSSFWKDTPKDWSSKIIWEGKDYHSDHAYD